TTGNAPLFGGTTRPLTLEDCEAIERRATRVRRLAPLAVGSARVGYGGKRREVTVLGSTPALLTGRHLSLGIGRFLPGARAGHRPVPAGRRGGSRLAGGGHRPDRPAGAVRLREPAGADDPDRRLALPCGRRDGREGGVDRHRHGRRGDRPGLERAAAVQPALP